MSVDVQTKQRAQGRALKLLVRFARHSVLEIVLAVLCLVLAFRAEGFLSQTNLLNVLRNVSMQGVIAFGMTMVIISGEIDLSVGSAVAFSGCLTAWFTGFFFLHEMPMPLAVALAIVISLGAGLCIGCITGLLRTRFGVPTFISTLAWLTVLKGASELITDGFPLTPFPDWYNFIGGGYLFGIPFPALLFLAVFALTQLIMGYTAFGRWVYAVGGNTEAARISGIGVHKVKIGVMGAVGLLAALSGVMQSSQIMSGAATTAVGWELDIISAVIIGGTSLMGGSGTIWGTLVGVIFLGVLVNGMTLLNISEYWQHVVRGALILTAVLINLAPAKRRS
ncbi:MAG: ABC transporter permease [Candidatus Hydrogenedentes bacterium]|nr:ABC transporter permease [Candidatus Hydrogenedentota bacterium]